MKSLILFLSFLSITALADQKIVSGYIFKGGWTFSSENYILTNFIFERIDNEIRIKLDPQIPTKECVKQFGSGTLESSNQVLFSNSTNYRYKIPVIEGCGSSTKFFRLEIAFYNDSQEVKWVFLRPDRRKASAYFSTEF